MSASIDLNWLRAFIMVHQTQSFSRAAEQLGVPRSTVSRNVSALEDALGIVLFHRTTRRVVTTPEGHALFEQSIAELKSIERALDDAQQHQEPTGTLRLSSTFDIGLTFLPQAIGLYHARHPKTSVELQLSNEIVDLVGQGIDLALRIFMGPVDGNLLTVRRLGVIRFQLFASRSYLDKCGLPDTLEALEQLEWLTYRHQPKSLHINHVTQIMTRRARLICDDVLFARAAILGGLGVGLLPSFVAQEAVTRGELVPLMPQHQCEHGVLYLVHPTRKHALARVRAFGQVLDEVLKDKLI